VSFKRSAFRDRHLGTQSFLRKVLGQARVPHDSEVGVAGNDRSPADILLRAWDGRRYLAVDLTTVHPNPATGRPLRGSAATVLKDKGEQKVREGTEACGRMGVDFSPMVFDTWGGLHGAGKAVVKAVFARCTACLLPGARPAAVWALRQGLSVQLGRSVVRKLEALMIVSTEAPAWWAAALPATPATRLRATRSGEPPKQGRKRSNPGPYPPRISPYSMLVLTSPLFPRIDSTLVLT